MQSNSLLYLYEKFSVASMTETIIQTRFWTQDWRVEVTDPLKFPLTALPVGLEVFAGGWYDAAVTSRGKVA